MRPEGERMRTKLRMFAALAMAVFLLAACAGKHNAGERITGQAPAETSSTSESSDTLPTPLTVTATELENDRVALEVPTGGVPAGQVAVTFLNVGTTTHEVSIVKIADGNFDKFKATLSTQGLAPALSGNEVVGAPLEAPAGESDKSRVTLAPGVYALLSQGTAPDGKSFAEHGMLAKLTVEPESETSASAPS